MALVNLQQALSSALEKVKVQQSNQVALPAREHRLTAEQTKQLEAAIELAFKPQEVRGHWKSGTHGYEPGDLLELRYEPNGEMTKAEMIAIANEAARSASSTVIAEHIASLAAHKRYNGGQGFTFVVHDLVPIISTYSELAIKRAFDNLKFSEGPWFPETHEILIEIKWQQKLINNLMQAVGALS